MLDSAFQTFCPNPQFIQSIVKWTFCRLQSLTVKTINKCPAFGAHKVPIEHGERIERMEKVIEQK